ARADDPTERRPEELLLRHEPQEPAGKQRYAERPRIEVRPVVRGEHAAAVGEVLAAAPAQAKHDPQHRPADHADEEIQHAGPRRARHRGGGYVCREAKRRRIRSLRCPVPCHVSSLSNRPPRRARSPATSAATTSWSRASATSAICRSARRTSRRTI